MTTLRLTDAGRAAIMDATNRQIRKIQIRSLAIGTGTGPGGADDDARTTLRAEVMRAALTGTTVVRGRLALRADFTPTNNFTVTEAGLVARIGGSGAEFLLAYWAAPSADTALAPAVANVSLVIVTALDVTQAAAEIVVTVGATITFASPPTALLALTDTPAAYIAARYARVNAAGDAMLWDEAPPVVATEAALPGGATQAQSVFLVQNYATTGYPALALFSGGAWRYAVSLPIFAVNSHTRAGLTELATNAEHTRSSPASALGATPAGVRAEVNRQIALVRSGA